MSADRETTHDMTQTDIALLLADAADEVDIGTAPVQAVIRGGRRRRARRWAVAATTAVVLAGSTGATLAVTGLPGGHGDRGASVATSPGQRHVYTPQRTELSRGSDHGKDWRVVVSVWGVPRDGAEANGQRHAMTADGINSEALPRASGLVGKTSYFVSLYYGNDHPRLVLFDTVGEWDRVSGTDLGAGAVPLAEEDVAGPHRLVVGRVAKTAEQVKCTWQDGSSTAEVTRDAAGTPVKWFVCVGPEGTGWKDVKVLR
ncbi:hypothetical protein [Streptomyces sp. NPDC051636]|uniref:hypothetical protein n=1 Tax=Streptomyces sp. NPDC051636 TaxID=3365663 RepID=UPI00379F98E6